MFKSEIGRIHSVQLAFGCASAHDEECREKQPTGVERVNVICDRDILDYLANEAAADPDG